MLQDIKSGFSAADWEDVGLSNDQLANQALDELFRLTQHYRSSEAYSQLCFLAHRRFGIDNFSQEYLSGYVEDNKEVPAIRLEAVMTASGLVERMGL